MLKIYINTMLADANDVKTLIQYIKNKKDKIQSIKTYKNSIYIYTI